MSLFRSRVEAFEISALLCNTVTDAPRLRAVWCRLLLQMLLEQGHHLLVSVGLGNNDWSALILPHNSRVRTQYEARQLSQWTLRRLLLCLSEGPVPSPENYCVQPSEEL